MEEVVDEEQKAWEAWEDEVDEMDEEVVGVGDDGVQVWGGKSPDADTDTVSGSRRHGWVDEGAANPTNTEG